MGSVLPIVIDALSDELIEVAVEHWRDVTSPLSSTLCMHLGGKARQVPAGATAAGYRDANYILVAQGAWEEAAESDRHIAWVRDFFNDIHPHSSGATYVNFLTEDEGDDRTRQAYNAATYQRLVEVKNRYDPGNFFRLNKNIQPAVEVARSPEAVPAGD